MQGSMLLDQAAFPDHPGAPIAWSTTSTKTSGLVTEFHHLI